MKRFILCTIMALCLISSSCDAQTRRSGQRGKEEIPQQTDTIKTVKVNPKVNVYIENSGSMDGFVKGITEFKDAIGKLLAKLKYYYDEENVQIYFIRNDRAKSKKDLETINVIKACETDIIDFAKAIDLSWKEDMKRRGHNTNLNNIFKEILNRTDDKTISVLFSDCIYSIGSGGVEALLSHEKWTTYDAFLTHSKKNKGCLATTIIKMKSDFDGKYYPYTGDGNAFLYKGELPYYICVLANQAIMADFNKNIKLGKGEIDGYDNKYILAHSESANLYYSILMATENKGRFKPQRQCSSLSYVHGIEDIDLKPNKRTSAPFSFAVALDMKKIDVEEDYLLDTRNYVLTEDNFKVVRVEEIDKNSINANDWQRIKDGNPTHYIVLEAKDMRWTNVELGIALKKQEPGWIEDCNILDDTQASKLEGGKSFGLKFWIHGISEAYEEIYPEDKNYYQVSINIKK